MSYRLFKVIQRETNRFLFKKKSSIIVAGLGRSGTTMVYNSLVQHHFYKPTNFCVNLVDIQEERTKGLVFKTHDLPPEKIFPTMKLIYLFGNPMNTVLSTHRKINEWGRLHHIHLHSDKFESCDNILYKDTLMLNAHFTQWYQKQNFSFISVKYETLYEKNTQKLLSDYLGFSLKLFPQKPRKTNWKNDPMGEIVFKTYKELYEKIEQAEKVKIWEPL